MLSCHHVAYQSIARQVLHSWPSGSASDPFEVKRGAWHNTCTPPAHDSEVFPRTLDTMKVSSFCIFSVLLCSRSLQVGRLFNRVRYQTVNAITILKFLTSQISE